MMLILTRAVIQILLPWTDSEEDAILIDEEEKLKVNHNNIELLEKR